MTYYDILGVPPTATKNDIRNAYLKLAKEFHPDKLAGIPPAVRKLAEEKFKDVQEAYEILTKHRAEYDNQLRAVGQPSQPAPPPRPAHPPTSTQTSQHASPSSPSSPQPFKRRTVWYLSGKFVGMLRMHPWAFAVGIFLLIAIFSGLSSSNTVDQLSGSTQRLRDTVAAKSAQANKPPSAATIKIDQIAKMSSGNGNVNRTTISHAAVPAVTGISPITREVGQSDSAPAKTSPGATVRDETSIGISKDIIETDSPPRPNTVSGSQQVTQNEGPRRDLSQLTIPERESIEAACSHDKYLNGPAAYNACLQQQLAQLAAAPGRPDLSSLSIPERESIEAACSHDKYLNGPASYNTCLRQQLAQLTAASSRPDLSSLSIPERESIEAACSHDKYLNGPAAYNNCLRQQLVQLAAAPGRPDLSNLNVRERESIEAACSHDKYLNGPAAYNSCLVRQLESLRNYNR